MADGRIPILYVAPWVDLGGSDKGTIDWFKHLDRERWAPSLITTQPSANRWLHHVEPYAEEVWDLPELMPGARFPEFILGFIESRGVRVVHIMNSRLGFDLLADMTCLPEPPAVVVQMHAEEPDQAGYVRYVARRYGNLVDAFSVTSEHLKGIVADYEIPPSKIEVIHSGVDAEEEFDPSRVEPLELAGNGAPRVLWPGRLVEQKDPMLTLEVLRRARDRGGEFVLDIVGDGHLEDQVRARAAELGVAEMIAWHPPSQEMPRWYRSSDLLLMTSVYEGVPYVIYESLAMGVPVVAPALPGNLEFMDSASGALVDPRDDADRYAEALVALLDDEGRRRAMGERSRQRMLEEFSLADMGRRHGELYDRLLAGRTASSRWRNEQPLGDGDAGVDSPAPPPPEPLRLPRRPAPERSVGVIVPCYQHGIFLAGCVASIKAQTVPATAIVVVDDGSEDPETVVALAALDDDPQVEVLRQPRNLGPSAARNRAIEGLETSYVLPIDADDELLPDALEMMLAQLEEAPEDIGFVYPHAQHIGNRSDFLPSPAYNLWLLMRQNYCPAPALFDRRLFGDGGVSYPEEIVVGHEDWDLILQLAERGVWGIPADGPTFLYRRQGLSRVHAVDFGPDSFHNTIEGRHRNLYERRDELKAEWAPALSVILLDEDAGAWEATDLASVERQTCDDFELLAGSELADGVRAIDGSCATSNEWLAEALGVARGRWVLLLPRSVSTSLRSCAFVERLLHCLVANPQAPAVALAAAPDAPRHSFAQLDGTARHEARPAALAFERPAWSRLPEVELNGKDSPLASIVVALQVNALVQWRVVPVAPPGPPWVEGSAPAGSLDLNRRSAVTKSEKGMLTMLGAESARLPELTPGAVRRWDVGAPWTPPQTQTLYRHVDPNSGMRMVNFESKPPPGLRREQVLGSLHSVAAPGLRRLVHVNHSFELTDEQGGLPEGHFPLGYLEQQPLPMLEGLELRRVPETGQEVLVCGPSDPLLYAAEPVMGLGYIEPTPILPRPDQVLRPGAWRTVALRRLAEHHGRRHRYLTGDGNGTLLGTLHLRAAPGLVALRRLSDGRLASDLKGPGRASRDPRKVARWVAQPWIRARRGTPVQDGTTLDRLGYLLRHPYVRRAADDGEGEVLGWLRGDVVPGTRPLYSAIHPATGDQMVTRFPEEAGEQGYFFDGVLGAIIETADP